MPASSVATARRVLPVPRGPWTEQHVGEDLRMQGRHFKNALLQRCRFERMRSAVLDHCCLSESKIEPRRVVDLLGLTVTLDCLSWRDVELNPLAFDMMMYLLAIGRGNDEKRHKLISMIEPAHMIELVGEYEKVL